MTRKLQHLFGRATLLLLLFFVSGVTFAQIAATVKCEIRGEGSANLNGLNADWSSFDFPIVSGETYTFDQLYGVSGNNTSISIGTIKGTLIDILIDGVHNEYSWSRYQGSGGYSSSILLTPDNDYYAELTLVFEGGEEPVATQTYTVDVVGQGSVDYSYTSESGDVKTGTFEPGVATGLDNMSMGAAYIIDITPRAAEGYKFGGMKMNGEEVADALQQYEEAGFVTLETAATEVNLEVTFKEDVPEYNVLYTVTIEGEGSVDYQYYIDGSDTWEKASGTFELGVQTGLNPKMVGPTYGVDIYPKPAEGYKFVGATVNGAEKTDALSKYEKNGFFPVNSAEKEIALHLIYEKEAVENPYTFTVTIEGEGGVDYWYLKNSTFEKVEGVVESGVAIGMDPYVAGGVYFIPKAAEGYEFSAAYVNGEEHTAALEQMGMYGYFFITPETTEVEVKVVFKSTVEIPEEYDMIVDYSQEGEGAVGYFYFIKGIDSAEGNLVTGLNVFPEMYKSSSAGYSLTLYPKPAEGYTLKALYINDVKVNATSSYLYRTKEDKQTVKVRAEFEAEGAKLVFEPETAEGKIAVTDTEGNALETGKVYEVGTNVNIAVTPAEGYLLKSLKVGETELTLGEPVDGTYTVAYTLVKGENKIVAEYEQAAYDIAINLTVEGEGTVNYSYQNAEPVGETTTGTLVAGENKFDNVYESQTDGYCVTILPEPKAGFKVVAVYADEVELTEMEEGGYLVGTKTQMGLVNVRVVFERHEIDMAVNYTQEGEGSVSYSYFLETDGSAKGDFVAGTNEFKDIYLASDGYYKMYITINPATGSLLKSVTVDGTDMTETYNNDGTLLLKSVGGETIDVKVVFEKEQQEPTGHKVVIKANGDIEYHIKFSNVAEQKQEFYFVFDKDTTVYLPDNAFCGWNYTYNPNFTVKNLLINGEPLLEPTFTVTSDLEISLDYVETGYYELEYEQPENGEIIVEYEVYDMNVYDYVYVPYEEGLALMTGTGYRVTYIADEDSYIANVKVNGEEVMNSTLEDPVYEFVYEGKVWGPVLFEAEILTEIAVDEVVAEPVQMTVYSVDGVLVRSCLAKDVKEAVEGLEKGLYIVNGQKVLVK